MQVFSEIGPLKAFLRAKRREGRTVGFVPTMGALHDGHLTLVAASKAENDLTVCSIYVNPTQFNNPSDLEKYPRTYDQDSALLEAAGCDVLFFPPNAEMYGPETLVRFDFGYLDKVMEGKFRPGHFSGVALVVSKLFNITEADIAYFGQKDWQQFSIIQRLVAELKFNIGLRAVPTKRENDGLAMSSRNMRLNADQRKNATVLYRALVLARRALQAGEDITPVREKVTAMFEKNGAARLEYFELADSANLNLLDNVNAAERPILCIAGFVGEVRLIDNMFLD